MIISNQLKQLMKGNCKHNRFWDCWKWNDCLATLKSIFDEYGFVCRFYELLGRWLTIDAIFPLFKNAKLITGFVDFLEIVIDDAIWFKIELTYNVFDVFELKTVMVTRAKSLICTCLGLLARNSFRELGRSLTCGRVIWSLSRQTRHGQ
jgi:hypothetical protein